MKLTSLILLSAIALFNIKCSTTGSSATSGADTVFLESGVKYVIMKEGTGAPVEEGTEVATNINLMINTVDDTVWSTYGDIPFAFVAKKTSLIQGFDEVVMYLKKGDRILAVIPPELGYGARGNGPDIPPNALLYFDLSIEDVRPARIPVADLLFKAWEAEGVDGIVSSFDTLKENMDLYKIDDEEWYNLSVSLADNKAWNDIVEMWDYKLADKPMLGGYYYKARAYDSLNQINKAIEVMEEAVRVDSTNNPNLRGYLQSLQSRQ